jgi:lipopolysaccharide assembly outer membrane protein LptD (OstA)
VNPTTRSLASVLGALLVSAALIVTIGQTVQAQQIPDDQVIVSARQVDATEGPRGRVVTLRDSVTITMRDARVRGSSGLYFESEGRALVFGDVTGTEGGRSIAADTLEYVESTDVVTLDGSASYSDSTGTTSADVIRLFRRQNVAVCSGRVRFTDVDGTVELTAGRLVYDFDREEGRASRGPRLITRGEDGGVDGTLTAEVVEFRRAGGALTAFGSVEIEREEIVARSRTAVLERDGTTTLEGDPSVDREGDRLTGERILVFGQEGEVSRVIALDGAQAVYHVEPDGTDVEPAQGVVTGDTLTMFIEEREPVLTTVRGRATSEHEVGSEGERNVVQSRAIDVIFDRGRISRVTFTGGASGVYFFPPEEGSAAATDDTSNATAGNSAAADDTSNAAAGDSAAAATDVVPAATDAAGLDAQGASLDSVAYASDRISYYVARNRITLEGGARVEYETTVLLADEVMFDPDGQYLEATGNPDLREDSERLVGQRLGYDMEGRVGEISGGVTTFEDGLYYGGRIVREADGTLQVNRGVYTTCAASEPHFSLVSHRMKIYMNDKVIAKPVILYIGRIPVLALPFYVFPIRRERHSGFLLPQIEVGLSEDKGRFVRNFGYYWAPSDYWDASVWADYYDQTSWIGHVEARYKLRYVLSGSASASFMQELLNNRRRWDLKLSHRQEFGRVWTAGASGDFRSDATYASDSNQSIQESVNRSLHSQLWVRGRWSGHTLGLTLDRREDLDAATVSELLPKAEFTVSQRPLLGDDAELPSYLEWLTDVSHNWSARLVNDRDRGGGTTTVRQGVGLSGSIRGSRKLLGWLNLSPRVSLAQNWYDRDRTGEELPSRFTYSTAVSARTTVYGTFFPRTLGVEAARHIVEPSASFSWAPEFPQYFTENGTDRFFSFSGFGSTPRERKSLNVSLVNKLQLKIGSGEEVRRIDNLLRVATSASYNFLQEERPWSNLASSVELRPGTPLSLRWNAAHDAYDGSIQSSSITATVDLRGQPPGISSEPWEDRIADYDSPADELRRDLASRSAGSLPGTRPWDATVTFRYSRGADPDNATYWVDGGLALSPSRKWRINYALHYDLEEQEVASQEYTVYRDLHCWEAQFTRRYYEGEWEYYFRISVKAIPEIQAEAGRKFLQRSVR